MEGGGDPKAATAQFHADLATQAGLSPKDLQDFLAKKSDAVETAMKLAAVIGTKLPEIDVQDFRRSGYLPEALLNFIVLIGWSPGHDREILTRQETIDLFSLDGIQKTPGRFDRKKLAWMNGEYIRKSSVERLIEAIRSFAAVTDYPLKEEDDALLRQLLALYQERMQTLAEMAEGSRFFFEEPTYDAKAVEKFIQKGDGLAQLRQIRDLLASAPAWTKEGLAEPFERILALGERRGAASQGLRVAVSGTSVSPPLLETIVLLGRDKTLARIDKLLG